MLEFVGDWSDGDKAVVTSMVGNVNGKISGKGFVANPWLLIKQGDRVKVESNRHTVKPINGSIETVGKAIKDYYAN